MGSPKKINMFGIVLVAVSSILVVDTIAASAIIGPSAIAWWVIMFLLFFLPYGLVTAELGTAYPDEGGIVDWVNRAFGEKVAARVAWLYWINYALWIPAVFYLFALVGSGLLGIDLDPWAIALVAIGMSWFKVWLTMRDLDQFMWIPNVGSVFKSIIMLVLGIAGIWVGIDRGFANEFTASNIIPSLDAGMSYLPVIIFNFMGFEIIAGASSALKNPSRDIPKAVLLGGGLIMVFYILATLGILATMPVDQISDSTGAMEAFAVIFGNSTGAKALIAILGVMFLYTLISNVATWAMGVNRAVVYAAEQGLLPDQLSRLNAKTGAPRNVALWNGVVATIVMLAFALVASPGGGEVAEVVPETVEAAAAAGAEEPETAEDLFWDVFSLGAITLLASYTLLFPAFLKLRLTDHTTPRPYLVPGGKAALYYCGIVPTILLILGMIFFVYVPGLEFDVDFFRNVGFGLLVTFVVGEIIIRMTLKKKQSSET